MPVMTSSVDALPAFWIVSSDARCPSTRTMLVCGGKPSRTHATSARRSCVPLIVLIGRSLSSATVLGAALRFDVVFECADLRRAGRQDQVLRADRVDDIGRREPLRLQLRRVQVDLTWRVLPPYGYGTAAPGTVMSSGADEIERVVVELLLGQPLSR